MTRRIRSLLLLLVVLALVAAACGNDDGGTATTAAGGETTTTAAGGGGGSDDDIDAACAADDFGCVEVAAGAPIKMGTLLAISGSVASLGLDSQHGAELASDYLDGTFDGQSGELMGHTITWNNQDDGCSAEGGQTGAQALAADPETVAVVGTSCSSAALGVADTILSDKGILLVSPSNTGPALTDPETHKPFYLRTAHNDKVQGRAVAEFAKDGLGTTSAATIHDGSPYAEGLANVFADVFASLGGTITSQNAVQVGDTDFIPLLTTIAVDQPEVLYYPIFPAEGGLITQQARQVEGIGTLVSLLGSDGLTNTDFFQAAGESAIGMYLSGPDLSKIGEGNTFYQDEFLPAYEAQFGSAPTAVFHAHAFDAANIIFDGIKQVAMTKSDGTLVIPRTALKDAVFATSNYAGLTGTLTCNADGDCQQSATIAVQEVLDANGTLSDPVYSQTIGLS